MYFDVDFIECDNLGYKKWCRQHAQRKRKKKIHNKKDPFETIFNKALIKWENVLQVLLSKIISEQKNRILRYKEKYGSIQYREIDFIAKLTDDSLVLCEIKLKTNYCKFIPNSGWKQLNKSLRILCNKYTSISGLAICVDMSHIYGTNKTINGNIYCNYSDIKNYFALAFSEKNTIWLNSLNIAKLAVEYDLLSDEEVNNMKNIFNQKSNPLSILKEDKIDYDNKPFMEILKDLKA